MNFTKIIIVFLILISIFCIPVNAQIINGDFETGDFTGWTISGYNYYALSSPHTGSYGVHTLTNPTAGSLSQTVDTEGHTSLEFYYKTGMWGRATLTLNGIPYLLPNDVGIWTYAKYSFNSADTLSFSFSSNNAHGVPVNMWLDDVNLCDWAASLMEFTNEPVEVGTYAHLECNLNDYWNTHANEHFYLSYDYYYKNMSNYTVIDYNELELNTPNTINLLPTYYPYFNQTGGCEIKASILYTYNDPVYTEVELGGIGYYVSTVLVNSTYEPPEEPEEPEEPEIPDPVPDPNPFPKPPIPPTQPNGTGANQSINVSWTGGYYNAVNNTFGGLCSPIYNFTNWSLSPIYSLNNSIGEFNYHMNESFTQTAQDSSILYESINIIFGVIHPKIRNVITYYLIWLVLLIIFKKD